MSDIEEVLKRLPKLSAAELSQVKARLNALAGGGLGAAPERRTSGKWAWGDFLIDCIANTLRNALGVTPSRDMMKGMRAYSTFQNRLPMVEEYLNRAAPNHAQRLAIARVGVDLLYAYLTRPGRAVGAVSLMQDIYRLPEVLEAQFPNYAKLGIMHMVARRVTP